LSFKCHFFRHFFAKIFFKSIPRCQIEVHPDEAIELRQSRRPTASFAGMARAVAKFLGVPERRNAADYDVARPKVNK
jgi:hypothetical protein